MSKTYGTVTPKVAKFNGKESQAEKAISEFENMRNMAELRALSSHSLEHPLTQDQYNRMMELKEMVFGVSQ